MREILFRGKRLDNGEWVEGHLLWYEDGRAKITPRHTDIFVNQESEIDIYHIAYEVDPETVGQYTGLKDKHGKKIFEGDVLKITNPFEKSISYYISFKSSSFVVNQIGINFCTYLSEFYCGEYEIEIIGNKFKNSELLEEEK